MMLVRCHHARARGCPKKSDLPQYIVRFVVKRLPLAQQLWLNITDDSADPKKTGTGQETTRRLVNDHHCLTGTKI